MQTKIVNDTLGNPIHLYFYEPENQPIIGVIHVIHGASEHFARYGGFAESMNKHGFAVIGADLLGHGLSTTTHEYVHFGDLGGNKLVVEALDLVKQEIKTRYPGVKRYLLGHSMGSFLARLTMIQDHDTYDKAVFSGTAFVPQALTGVGLFLCKTIRLFHGPKHVSPLIQAMSIDANPSKMRKDGIIGARNVEWLTKDVDIQNYYDQSPMCGQPFTVSANADLFTWLKFINSTKNIEKGNKKTPIFFASGANDALGGYGKDVVKLSETYQKLGYEQIKVKIYPNDRHEIMNETDKKLVYQDIIAFLNA